MRTWRRSWTQKSSRCSRLSSTRQMRRLWQPQTHKLQRLQQAWRLTANRWYRKVLKQKNRKKILSSKSTRHFAGDTQTNDTTHEKDMPFHLSSYAQALDIYFFSLHFELMGKLADFIQERERWTCFDVKCDPAAGLDSVIMRRMPILIFLIFVI